MPSQETSLSVIKKVYNHTLKSFKNNPALIIPFLIFAIFEFSALIFIYFSPRAPLVSIFGPPIRTFWGEVFLHYPTNFLLLPKLASLSRLVLTLSLSSLLTGMVMFIILDIQHKKEVKLGLVFKSALQKYISLFTIVLIFILLFQVFVKITTIGLTGYFMAGHSRLLFFGPGIWLGPILALMHFIFAIFIQAAFIYAIPALIIGQEKLIQSIGKSFLLFKKLFIPTLILVGLPMLIYIPIMVLSYNTDFLIDKLFPEFILWVAFLNTVVSSLIIDPLVTVSTALLYLENKAKG